MLTIIPVFSSEFPVFLSIFVLNFFCTNTSHAIIHVTPNIIPNIIIESPDISNASGTRSKHTIDIMSP